MLVELFFAVAPGFEFDEDVEDDAGADDDDDDEGDNDIVLDLMSSKPFSLGGLIANTIPCLHLSPSWSKKYNAGIASVFGSILNCVNGRFSPTT